MYQTRRVSASARWRACCTEMAGAVVVVVVAAGAVVWPTSRLAVVVIVRVVLGPAWPIGHPAPGGRRHTGRADAAHGPTTKHSPRARPTAARARPAGRRHLEAVVSGAGTSGRAYPTPTPPPSPVVSAGASGRSRWCGRRPCAVRAACRHGGTHSPGPGPVEVAGVRATPLGQVGQGDLEVVGQPAHLGPGQRSGRTGGVETGSPERLIDQQVPDAGDPALVEQPGLERRLGPGQPVAQRGRGDAHRVEPQPSLVGVELDPAQAPGILHPQRAAVGEAEPEAIPGRLVAGGRVLEPVHGRDVVDDQPAGHAESQPETCPESRCRCRAAAASRCAAWRSPLHRAARPRARPARCRPSGTTGRARRPG